jgi:hypothetical protein
LFAISAARDSLTIGWGAQDYGVIDCFLSKLFGGHAVPQYFGHNVPHHASGSEH